MSFSQVRLANVKEVSINGTIFKGVQNVSVGLAGDWVEQVGDDASFVQEGYITGLAGDVTISFNKDSIDSVTLAGSKITSLSISAEPPNGGTAKVKSLAANAYGIISDISSGIQHGALPSENITIKIVNPSADSIFVDA